MHKAPAAFFSFLLLFVKPPSVHKTQAGISPAGVSLASSCEQNAHDSLSTAEVLPSQKSHASLLLSGVVGGSQPPLGRTCPPHRLRTHVHARPTAEPFERNGRRGESCRGCSCGGHPRFQNKKTKRAAEPKCGVVSSLGQLGLACRCTSFLFIFAFPSSCNFCATLDCF